jgi:predicted glycosyltransferase
MAAIGGTFIAHVGKMTGIPSLVFYDTENAKMQNIITYPLASRIYVPNCYEGWVPRNHVKYAGYHELAYLHPHYFKPSKTIAEKNGLILDQKNYFIRIVSWKANHDLSEKGWPLSLLRKIVAKLKTDGNIIISSESDLPKDLSVYAYKGSTAQIHHVMAFCRAYIGESATMASESTMLGVPALYIARTGRGYTNEQEKKYAMVRNVTNIDYDEIEKELDALLAVSLSEIKGRHHKMISSCIDVSMFVANTIDKYLRHRY